jgi:beta-glucosidase-like glycosyl hydrolase
MRDPRFGRNSELPSEDPFLAGEYAAHYVRGMQDGLPGHQHEVKKMISGLKHYAAYTVEADREAFIPTISTFDLADSYLPQYEAAFSPADEGGNAQAVMCSYAGANGVPSCANSFLLNDLIRNKWRRPDAIVTSDCGALSNMVGANHYAKDNAHAASESLNAGCDIDMGPR